MYEARPCCHWSWHSWTAHRTWGCPRNSARRSVIASISRSSHSQTVSTPHPPDSSRSTFFASRVRFPRSFFIQKSRLDVGMVARLQPGCWCQKQPLTKTTFLREGNTKSGFPGKSVRCRRYLYPILCRARRTTISGIVPLDLTAAIIWLRLFGIFACPIND